MDAMSRGVSRRRSHFVALLPSIALLAGLLVAPGCARVAATPVATSPANVPPPAGLVTASPPGSEPTPLASTLPQDQDAAPESVVPAEEDVQAAEEVEPSPLDELPETAPAVSPSTLEKDKGIVAEGFPNFDIPMVLNDQVVAFVEYLSNQHKELFAAGLDRSGRFVESFQKIFEQAGLPKDLVFMAHVESAFKTNAYSRAKAKGIFQFIAETGRRYGLRIDSWVDERSDPEKSARAAAAYLKDLYGMFGDWYLALAAYNAGEGKIQRSIAQTKKNDFWALASTRSLRAETKNYVPAILAATLIAKDPQKFGFEVHPESPVSTDAVRIDGQTDLRILARIANVDAETLRQMNPQLRRGMTPPGATTDVHVPSGLGEAVAQAYANLPVAERLVLARHQVASGESLGSIAKEYGVTTTAIASANRLGKAAALKPGQQLVIPAVSAEPKERMRTGTSATAYRVRKGDTLSIIASRYRTTPAAIANASGIDLRSNLLVGQRLVVPVRGAAPRASEAPASHARVAAASPVVHTVRPGETLYRIAGKYQVTVDQICALNRIAPNGVLYPGTRLTIRSN